MRFQIHDLELVYPPISNQEAEWLVNHKEVREDLSKSNLYFIGQKPESFFLFDDDFESTLKNEERICFKYKCGDLIDTGHIDIKILLAYYREFEQIDLEIELGEKLIRLWDRSSGEKVIIEWFTTDKILFHKSRGVPFIEGFSNYQDFYIYNLHYVGIAKKQSGFERLVVEPHDKRLRILSNEHPLNLGSRVTDEIYLFFFRVNSLEIKQYAQGDDFSDFGKSELEDHIRIVAEAEKALVKIMDTDYNEVKFDQFPYSEDGLFKSLVDKHSFSIDENIKFITDSNTIVGKRKNPPLNMESGDFIAICKETVELIKIV